MKMSAIALASAVALVASIGASFASDIPMTPREVAGHSQPVGADADLRIPSMTGFTEVAASGHSYAFRCAQARAEADSPHIQMFCGPGEQ